MRSMFNESWLLVPRQVAALLLVCVCLLASTATRAAPCHEAVMIDMSGVPAAAGIAARGAMASAHATSATMKHGENAHRHPQSARQRDIRQDRHSATGVGARTAMHHAAGASPVGDCCDGGRCAMDCGCAAVALLAAPAPEAGPARSALVPTTAIRPPSLAPGELLRPPIPA